MKEIPSSGKREGPRKEWDQEAKKLHIRESLELSSGIRDVVARMYGGELSITGSDRKNPKIDTTLTVTGDTKAEAEEKLDTKRGQLKIVLADTAVLIDGRTELDTDQRPLADEGYGTPLPDLGIQRRVDVQVPKDEDYRGYDLEMNVADTTVKNLSTDQLTIVSTFGNVDLTDFDGVVDFKTMGGNMKGKNVEGKATVFNITGETTLEKFTGQAKVRSGTGPITIKDAKFIGLDNNLSTDGDVNVSTTNEELGLYLTGPFETMYLPTTEEGFRENLKLNQPNTTVIWGSLGTDLPPRDMLSIHTEAGDIKINRVDESDR